ncbi:hypothetical protein M3027_18970, partial [Geoalkalibacter halelectricus]|nr:hypothetical protein [Geoalkalibacter halelectricus]
MISTLRVFAVLAIFVVAQPAFSQIAPDAGRILQELQTPPTLPAPSDGLVIEPPTRDPVAPGGPKAEVRNIEFSGHSVF